MTNIIRDNSGVPEVIENTGSKETQKFGAGLRTDATVNINRARLMLQGFTIEATMPSEAEIEKLREVLNTDTPIYLSAPPGHSHARLAQILARVRDAGFEPVPHIAARSYADRAALENFIKRVTAEAGVRQALVIAGDSDHAAGPYSGANAVIESDILQRYGIFNIGISGYPDGHPKIPEETLRQALSDKLKSAAARGLKAHIATQFCFDTHQIASWLRSIRASRIDAPIRIGVAGPSSVQGLARFAMRCGVRTSIKGMLNGKGSQMLGADTPDAIIESLAHDESVVNTKNICFHFYSFGGVVRTALWVKNYLERT